MRVFDATKVDDFSVFFQMEMLIMNNLKLHIDDLELLSLLLFADIVHSCYLCSLSVALSTQVVSFSHRGG